MIHPPGLKNFSLSRILNLIYPSECPLCKSRSDSLRYSPLCTACWRKILKYKGPACNICASPIVSGYATTCGTCLKAPPLFRQAFSFGLYDSALLEAIHSYKFSGLKRLATPLGSFFSDMDIPACDVLIPVPLSVRKLRERGFNQSLLLARVFSKSKDMPLYMDVLVKKKDTPSQTGLSAKERMKNIKGAFSVTGDITGLKVLLIDDVMTTGATARECSRVLTMAGAKEVYVATLARAGTI